MYKKGQSGNPSGRPQGAKDKTTKSIREKFNLLIENNFDKIQTDFESLTASERIRYYLEFARFVLPKLNSVEITEDNANFEPVTINIKDLFRIDPPNDEN